jgi:hypothetical protein
VRADDASRSCKPVTEAVQFERARRSGQRPLIRLSALGVRNVSRFTGNQRWNLQLCRALVKEKRDGFRLMTLAIIEFETGRLDSAEAHMVEAIRRAKAKRKIDLAPWHVMLKRIRDARAHLARPLGPTL